jgi:uncharacterized phiE125 gp8 family phage protein
MKTHLRLDHNDHNDMLVNLIQASREHLEKITGRAFVQQTRGALYKDWPSNEQFVIPYPPLQSVSSIQYTDTDGDTTTWGSSNYEVVTDSEPGLVVLAYGETWPSATLHQLRYPIEIQFVCGYESSGSPADYRTNVPEAIKNALKLDVELRYDRPPEAYARMVEERIASILAPYKVYW